ncbi:MAG: hypothetical protein CVU68_13045 [Deltaproteobacteria bacterium HGW-Deltaproteobacteria-3]|nr:MAG: hypothetical protein CVU68_13045 [Deltaproteobacteria bacterium HGW-Deltaproteobacteria-3]
MAETIDGTGIVLTAIDATSISAYSYYIDLKEHQAPASAPRKGPPHGDEEKMAIDDINTTNPVLPAALQNRTQTTIPLATSPLNIVKNPVAVATAATQNLPPAQQAALLGSEALRTLTLEPTSPAEPLLATGTTTGITTVTESEGLMRAKT